jgi:hypothetical protein
MIIADAKDNKNLYEDVFKEYYDWGKASAGRSCSIRVWAQIEILPHHAHTRYERSMVSYQSRRRLQE